MAQIFTRHIFPPIPDRSNDWVAYYDPEGGPRGYGATEQDAITDLITEFPHDDGEYDRVVETVGNIMSAVR